MAVHVEQVIQVGHVVSLEALLVSTCIVTASLVFSVCSRECMVGTISMYCVRSG